MTAAGGGGTSAAELESWVREELQLEQEATVTISEKPGNDPRCSPVITEVAIEAPDQTPFAFHIEHPLTEVVRMDLIATLAFGGGH